MSAGHGGVGRQDRPADGGGHPQRLQTFRHRLTRSWHTQLWRRRQRHRLTWDRIGELAARGLPVPRVLHPLPNKRFAASHPSSEVDTLTGARTDLCGRYGATRIPAATPEILLKTKRGWIPGEPSIRTAAGGVGKEGVTPAPFSESDQPAADRHGNGTSGPRPTCGEGMLLILGHGRDARARIRRCLQLDFRASLHYHFSVLMNVYPPSTLASRRYSVAPRVQRIH